MTSSSKDKGIQDNISTYLGSKKIYDKDHTHVSLGNPHGRFILGQSATFWDLYLRAVDAKVPLHLAEKPQDQGPILIDVDLTVKKKNITNLECFLKSRKVYSDSQVTKIIKAYQSTLRDILENLREDSLQCVLLEKPFTELTLENEPYVKNGFHLHFPKLFMDKKAQQIYLLPLIKRKLDGLFNNLEVTQVVDENYLNVHWLMYGSSKPDKEPYKVTKCYDHECNEVDLEVTFEDYVLPAEGRSRPSCRGQVRTLLPKILSTFLDDREDYYYYTCVQTINTPLLEKYQNKITQRKHLENQSITQRLQEAELYIMEMLDVRRADEYSSWLTVGFCLYNISQGDADGLQLWLSFSERSNKYDELTCIYKWENEMRLNNYTIGTLKFFARTDSPELYETHLEHQLKAKLMGHVCNNGSHNTLAKVLYEEYPYEFKYDNGWYQFVNHIWAVNTQEQNYELRQRISDDNGIIITQLNKIITDISEQMIDADVDLKQLQSQIRKASETIGGCYNFSTKNSIMGEAREVFYEKGFVKNLDKDPNLIAFRNGVYDFQKGLFRDGKPEDYLSKALPIDYLTNLTINDPKVIEVTNFFKKIFPDASLRVYFLDQISKIFVGGNHDKVCMFWTGVGNNGKTVTQNLIEGMLGDYAIDFPTTLVTGKKSNADCASPALCRSGSGVRWAVLKEPNADEVINGGCLKWLTGGDSFYARDLFQKGKETKEIVPFFKLAMICNKLPAIKDPDQATWNRVRVIPFESVFKEPEQCPKTFEEQCKQKIFPMDKNMSSRIIEMREALAWYLIYRYHNLPAEQVTPAKVLSAVNEYIQSNDVCMSFEKACIYDAPSDTRLPAVTLWEAFKNWFQQEFSRVNFPRQSAILDYFKTKWGPLCEGVYWEGKSIHPPDNAREPLSEAASEIEPLSDEVNHILLDADAIVALSQRASEASLESEP